MIRMMKNTPTLICHLVNPVNYVNCFAAVGLLRARISEHLAGPEKVAAKSFFLIQPGSL
jgi:hypothetical protein